MKIIFEVGEFKKFLGKLTNLFLAGGDKGLLKVGDKETIEYENEHQFLDDSLRIKKGEVNLYRNLIKTELIKGEFIE